MKMDSAILISTSVEPLYRMVKSSREKEHLQIFSQWLLILDCKGLESILPVLLLVPL